MLNVHTHEDTDREAHIGAALGQPLQEFVADRRPEKSWPAIVIDIYESAGVSATEQTLRRWNER